MTSEPAGPRYSVSLWWVAPNSPGPGPHHHADAVTPPALAAGLYRAAVVAAAGLVAATALVVAAAPALAQDDAPEPPAVPFHLPLPEGWRAETIPFPLGFAPGLPYTGLEELRFSPGMFQPDAEDYWSYSFIWWIEAGTMLDARTIADQLEEYFRGLAAAVMQDGGVPEDAVFEVRMGPRRTLDVSTQRFEGRVNTFEPFAARTQVTLNVKAEAFNCLDPDHRAVYFALSPQPEGHPVWTTLKEIRRGFRCHADSDE